MIPRGYRNNNPLNIRRSADNFQGELRGDDKSFKTFASMAYGYRAAFVTLATYHSRGWDTIEKIVSHWAPPVENDTERYIASVVKRSGIPRGCKLSLSDGEDYIRIVAAMSAVENGRKAVMSEVEEGFQLQNKIKMQ